MCLRRYGEGTCNSSASIGRPLSCSAFNLRDIHCTLQRITMFARSWLYLMSLRCSCQTFLAITSPSNIRGGAGNLDRSIRHGWGLSWS